MPELEKIVEQEQKEQEEFSDAFTNAAKNKDGTADVELDENLNKDDINAHADADNGKKAAEPDPYEGLSEAAIERIKAVETDRDALQHRIDSDDGRVNAYQNQVTELQTQIAADTGKKPTEQEVSDALAGSDEDWVEFLEEYPEVGGAIDARLKASEAKVAAQLSDHQKTMDERIAPVIEKNDIEITAENNDYMEEKHPGWTDRISVKDDKGVVTGPNPDFQTWLEGQPESTRGLAGSDEVEDASSLMTYYENHLRAIGKFEEITTPNDDGGEIDDSKGESLAAKRKRQLDAGQTVKSQGAGITTGPEGESGQFSSAFLAEANKRDQERRLQRA